MPTRRPYQFHSLPTRIARNAAILAFTLSLAPIHALADSTTWSSPVGGLWTNAASWSNGVPTLNTDAIVNATGAPYTITLPGTFPFANTLTFSSADATLNLDPTTSQAVLEIEQGLTMSAGTINIGDPKANNTAFLRLVGASQVTAGTINVVQGGLLLGRSSEFSGSGSLTFDGANASLNVTGGTIDFITLSNINGASFVINSAGSVNTNFSSVVLDTASFSLRSATVSLFAQDGTSPAVTGTGSFIFDGSDSKNFVTINTSLATGITIRSGTAGGVISKVGTSDLLIQGIVSSQTPSCDIKITGNIDNAGLLQAINGGTLHINGISSFTNAGSINVGTASTIFAPSSGILLNGGILSGYGTISGAVLAGTASHTIAPSANLPATSTGNLTMNSLSTNSNTTLSLNLLSPGTNDALDITATNGLTLNGGTIQIANVPNTASSLGYYKIIQYAGTIQGTGLSSLTLPTTQNGIAYFLDTTHDPGFIDLHRGLLGDTNDDGTVDLTDLTILASNWQKSGSWAQGDFDGSGFIDLTDLTILAENWQGSIASFQAAYSELQVQDSQLPPLPVPEPTTFSLLTLAAALVARRRRSSCETHRKSHRALSAK